MADPSTPASADASASTRPRVVYVMGAGRSGSTILGVTLGNCEGVFYAGELDKWLLRSGVPTRGGEERASFWRAVREAVPDAEPLFGREAQHYLERSSALLRLHGRSERRRMRRQYQRITGDLYRAIASAAGATHVVDTGHYPLRARELQRIAGIELYVLFLVREPHSLIASWSRSDVPEPTFGALKTNAYLWLTYLVSVYVFLRQPRERRFLLRHEDFLADPQGSLAEILQRIGAPPALPDLTALRTGFPLQGNRLIASEVVALKAGAPSPARRSATTALLQAPWSAVLSRLRPRIGSAGAGRNAPAR